MLKHRFSIKIHITTLFISLILILGGVLAWFNYLKVSEILISTSNRLFDHLADEVTDSIENNYFSVISNVKLLAETELPKTDTYADRQHYESAMIAILDNNPRTAAISLGYPDGDYFIIRAIVSNYMREKFEAPDNARFMIDHIESDDPTRQIQRKFIDNDLKLIGDISYLDTEYNPTIRPWFLQAQQSDSPVTTAPYLFYFIGKLGITLSYEDKKSGAVIAADLTLDEISQQLSSTYLTPSSHILLIDSDNKLVAYQDINQVLKVDESGQLKQSTVSDLNKPEINEFIELSKTSNSSDNGGIERSFTLNGVNWFGIMTAIPMSDNQMSLIVLSPENELLTEATNIRTSSTIITAVILFFSLPLTWLLALRVARPLIALTRESERIKDLDFEQRKTARSFVLEIDELAASLNSMRGTINQFITLVNTVTSEQEHETLLSTVTKETRLASQAKTVAIYLCNSKRDMLTRACVSHDFETSDSPHTVSRPYTIADQPSVIQLSIDQHNLQSKDYTLGKAHNPNLVDDLLLTSELTLADVVAIPLLDRKQDLTGIVVMIFERHSTGDAISDHKISFAKSLAGFCAESLEKNRLYNDQKQLLESFIKLIAGAIDAKSPYTGGHCQRVPALAKLLTQAACEDETEAFKDFSMSEEEWEALHIASWLHDCGKVTTPEYVVDKATRLETIYNRIHEIRTRFEILKRDTLIDHHKERVRLARQGELTETKERELEEALSATLSTLDEEFAFIAECNMGDKFMDQDALDKINQISKRTWQRTISDRLGISWEERKRKDRIPEQSLPITEKVLDDRVDHLIPRDTKHLSGEDNPWGFKMTVPELKFNQGEIYNLSACTGTLTAEERFIINDHIIQTIVMLDKLPFPNHLKDVPDIAGNHHERMDGKGYPRQRTSEEMSLQSKVMAIADIFEALTACDRPYKEAKSLSAALNIMKFMAKEGHIDPDLFKLFIRSGTYKEYSEKFLASGQMDEISEEEYLL
ncbi:HD domain-containing phosphohydrolase [Litoribrevibacter albus]|uniref:Phosphodiesterase n=1 Tax=Litoribrevibacter albus TaxID=1473156 RepID=A0AA37W5Q8_9GAMM|nr:HD domain-containing phosphohydrolase [Litoribrevibacter albus]GLQ30790.1 phosphodiesterase [Litoribrevibacter albus]